MQEIPAEEKRTPVEKTIHLAPDVAEWLETYGATKGSPDHVINSVLRLYRDSLPAPRKAAAAANGATPHPKPKPAAKGAEA